MKTIIFLCLFTFTLQAKMVTTTFSDSVKLIKPTKEGIKVSFEVQAAFYKLNSNNPNYKILKQQLEELQKSHKKIKIMALVPSMEIQEIQETNTN